MNIIFDLDQTLIDSRIAAVSRRKRNWHEVYSLIPQMIIYDEMIELIDLFESKKIGMVLVSSSPKTYIKKVINYFDIKISEIVGYHDTVQHKPNPEPILLAISKFNNPTIETYSLGDRDIDIYASKSAGVKTIGCAWGSDDKSLLEKSKPDYFFNDPVEVLNFFKAKSDGY